MINLSIATAFLSLLLFFIAPVSQATSPCIDINTAPIEELEKIKHIGESRAKQIIILREEKLFSSVDELDRVIGIGPAKISDIKQEGLACVQTQTPARPPEISAPTAEIATPTAEIQPQKVYPGGIIINEILPSPKGKDEEEEWIEIKNQNDFEVDLSSWKISDTTGSVTVYAFPEETKINPEGFLIIPRPESKITLNNSGDGLELMQPDENVLDSVSYENAPIGNSYNLIDGKWVWSNAPTPALTNILSPSDKEDKTIVAEEKKNLNSLSAEKQLASAAKQILESENPLPPFLAALALAIISGISILFFKKKVVKTNLE